MDETTFLGTMKEIESDLISQLEDQKAATEETFAKMIAQALVSKKDGIKELPNSFSHLSLSLVGDRWYWSFLNRVRNTMIDFLELPLEKK